MDRGDARDSAYDVVGRYVVLLVPGLEMACRDARIVHLVKAVRVEADGIGAGRFSGHFAQHAGHRVAVGTAAQKRPCQTVLCGVFDALPDQRQKLFFEMRERTLLIFYEPHFPIRLGPLRATIPHQERPRQETLAMSVDGLRAGHHVEIHVIVDRLLADLMIRASESTDRIERRTEDQFPAFARITERP